MLNNISQTAIVRYLISVFFVILPAQIIHAGKYPEKTFEYVFYKKMTS